MIADHQERSRNLTTLEPLNDSFYSDNLDINEWTPRQEVSNIEINKDGRAN